MELKSLDIGARAPLYYREGTYDVAVINAVFSGQEYQMPQDDSIKTILDIGANIGVVSVVLANRYPEAKIYAFEPVPENHELLWKNVEAYPNVEIYQDALGNCQEFRPIYPSNTPENLGGFSLLSTGADLSKPTMVSVMKASSVIESLGLQTIDLIKIDCEGSEYEILMDLREAGQLQGVRYIMGELHGIKDFELLGELSKTHDLAFSKPMNDRNYPFYARLKKP